MTPRRRRRLLEDEDVAAEEQQEEEEEEEWCEAGSLPVGLGLGFTGGGGGGGGGGVDSVLARSVVEEDEDELEEDDDQEERDGQEEQQDEHGEQVDDDGETVMRTTSSGRVVYATGWDPSLSVTLLPRARLKALSCALCRRLCKDAMGSEVCEHSFCRGCIRHYLQHRPRCPKCSVELDVSQLVVDEGVRTAVEQVEVKCPSEECTRSMTIARLERHQKFVCVARMVQCPICSRSLRAMDMNAHMNDSVEEHLEHALDQLDRQRARELQLQDELNTVREELRAKDERIEKDAMMLRGLQSYLDNLRRLYAKEVDENRRLSKVVRENKHLRIAAYTPKVRKARPRTRRPRRRKKQPQWKWSAELKHPVLALSEDGRQATNVMAFAAKSVAGDVLWTGGKRAFEVRGRCVVGIVPEGAVNFKRGGKIGLRSEGWVLDTATGSKYSGGSGEAQAYTDALSEQDVVGVQINLDTGVVEFFRNGESLGVAFEDVRAEQGVRPAVTICEVGGSVCIV